MIIMAFDAGGHALRPGDHVRDESGLLWVVCHNDPYFPDQYGCKPFLLYYSAKTSELGDRRSIEETRTMTYAADQPNVADYLKRGGFMKPCAGRNLADEDVLNGSTEDAVSGNRGGGCNGGKPSVG